MKFILFFFVIKQIISEDCDPSHNCLSCNNCWESKATCGCFFINGFCYNNSTNQYIYDNPFISRFEINKCPVENNYICGKSDISDEINDENFYNFLSFNDEKYLDDNNLLCYYTFKNNNEKINEDLIIELDVNLKKRDYNNFDNNKNIMFIFVQEINSQSESLYEINLNEFLDKKYNLKIAEYKSISIYINLIKNKNHINDYKISHINLAVKKDNSKAQNAKKYKYAILIICILCILCVATCFILYLIKYKRNREIYNMRAIGMANNMNELNNRMDPMDKKKKLEKLFKEKLKKRKYLKKLNLNETTACSICLEEFIENESLVCITPCSHIFHYDCLHNWLFTENSNCSCPYCNYNLLSNEPPKKRNKNKKESKEKIDNEKPNHLNNTSERFIKKKRRINDISNNNNLESNKLESSNEGIKDIKNKNNIEDHKNIENLKKEITQHHSETQGQGQGEEEDNDNNISFEKNGHIRKQKRVLNSDNNNNNINDESNNKDENIIINNNNNENEKEKEEEKNINNDKNENINNDNENNNIENKNEDNNLVNKNN
jgi:hypothetical protein